MTNGERWTRKIAHSPICARCRQSEENAMHAIRDCDHAEEVWKCLVSPQLLREFISKEMKDWIIWMVRRGKCMQENGRWVERMLTVTWFQWRRRCDEALGVGRPTLEQRPMQVSRCIEEDEAARRLEALQQEVQ